MSSLEALAMLPADTFNDPVSYHYEMRCPWGLMALDLTVDIKILINDVSYYAAIGEHLWRSAIATAITTGVSLDTFFYVRWLAAPLAMPAVPSLSTRGRIHATGAGRGHCPIVLMHSGHADNYAARRITLPATPIAWQEDGILTPRGWDELMAWAQGVRMGLAADDIGGDLQHLIAYPHVVEPTIENLNGVGFRRVTHLKVLQFTDKAPDLPSGLWP